MVQINFAQKTVNAKVVYYGPGMSGKTTNLEVVHQRAPEKNRGELTSISTDGALDPARLRALLAQLEAQHDRPREAS